MRISHPRVRPGIWALLAATVVAGCSKPAATVTPAVSVTVAVVRRESIPYLLSANGKVEPLETARIAAQVGGLVTDVTFREGDAVRQGRMLFRIEPRPYVAALEEAGAALNRDRVEAANARRGLERLRALRPQDYVTQSQVDSQATTATAEAATVASDRAAVVKAQFDLDNTVIRAPISGVTGSLLVRRGNLVAADPNQPLVVINRIDPILVRFTVPEAVLPQIQRARRAGTVPVHVLPVDGDTTAADSGAASATASTGMADPQGALTFIDNAVDTTTGTVQLKAQLRNPAGQLWPGQFVNVTLQLGVQPDALIVPTKSVQGGQQGSYVFVVQPDGRAVSRAVTLGPTTGGGAVIIERGLVAGERVVTDGQSQLTAGALVRVTGEDSTARVAGATAGAAP